MRLKVNDILSSYQVFHGLPLFQRQCECASVTESEGNKIQFCFNYCQLPFPPWELMQFFRLEHRKFAPTDIFPDFSTDIFQDFRNYILKHRFSLHPFQLLVGRGMKKCTMFLYWWYHSDFSCISNVSAVIRALYLVGLDDIRPPLKATPLHRQSVAFSQSSFHCQRKILIICGNCSDIGILPIEIAQIYIWCPLDQEKFPPDMHLTWTWYALDIIKEPKNQRTLQHLMLTTYNFSTAMLTNVGTFLCKLWAFAIIYIWVQIHLNSNPNISQQSLHPIGQVGQLGANQVFLFFFKWAPEKSDSKYGSNQNVQWASFQSLHFVEDSSMNVFHLACVFY